MKKILHILLRLLQTLTIIACAIMLLYGIHVIVQDCNSKGGVIIPGNPPMCKFQDTRDESVNKADQRRNNSH